MDENKKLEEARDYAVWMLKNLDPDSMYNHQEMQGKILEMIGYLTVLISK